METRAKKILVIDDEETAGKSIEKILSKKGCYVEVALSADEGLNKIETKLFELVLLDIMMPQVNGIELLGIIKKKWPSLNVVIITGYPSIQTAVETTRLGAFDYIPKPFTPDELRKKVDQALTHSASARVLPMPQRKGMAEKGRKSLAEEIGKSAIDIDMPFDYDEVAALTGAAYVDALDGSEIPMVEGEAAPTLCPIGTQTCDIYAKKARPCNTKDGVCPKVKRMKLKAQKRAKFLAEEIGESAIDIDMPFDYREVAKLASPAYVDALSGSDIPMVSWGELAEEGPVSLPEILVIDDEAIVGNSIRKILEPRGYRVEHAGTPSEAMGMLSERPVDMILLDMKMPGVKGLELLESIKEEHPITPVIMITGYASVETAVASVKMGATDYVPKPFTPDELHGAVEKGFKLAA